VGATVDEALADAENMLPEFLDVLREHGVPIPLPSAAEDVELRPGEMLAFVTLRAPAMTTS
jgi:predicted RNase H-like HicB family nuclease